MEINGWDAPSFLPFGTFWTQTFEHIIDAAELESFGQRYHRHVNLLQTERAVA